MSPLHEYRAKRSPERTPEPFGEGNASRPGLFVIQHHAARHLHFDLRLELDGVLKSWAVPKGPSLDPAEKRLAMEVEDHPVEYADFEGLIPKGNYGAGAVIVWDRGAWRPVEDPEEGLKKGKLLFTLEGYKLRGLWTLFRTRKGSKEWLLMKKPDAWASTERDLPPESILSGLTVQDLATGRDAASALRAELEKLGAPRRPVRPAEVEPMLAEARDKPFSGKGWLFELKYDGFRALASRDGAQLRLAYRRGRDALRSYPELKRALSALPFARFTLDGELVVLDEEGKPSFNRLQRRALITRPLDLERATVDLPVTLFVFDLLAFEDFDVRALPLHARKALLRRLLPATGPLRYADHVEERGAELFEQVRERGLEGVMAKKRDSRYRAGRSGDWLKIRTEKAADFAIVGYTLVEGGTGMGALHLAAYDEGERIYAGKVGTGFSDALRDELRQRLEKSRRATPPCTGAPKGRGNLWVEPELACEVRYLSWSEGGTLRHPVFLRLREDKRLEECVREGTPPKAPEPEAGPAGAAERQVLFTRLDKVFWPGEGYTKGDLIGFYREISPWLLPYLRDRPLVMTRFPDGIEGKSFFQKDAPGHVPSWIQTVRLAGEEGGREIDYVLCNDEETLLYVANLGSIPLHIGSSRVQSLQQPDWCILDLDPKEAPFEHVLTLAQAIHALCDDLELPCYPKTSGQAGMHVLIPLGRQCTHTESRTLAELLARVIEAEHPKLATIARALSNRGGRVYVDYLQNGYGKTLVSPFSVRPRPGAPVSTPLHWSEVNATLDPRAFTLRTVPARMKQLQADPLRAVLEERPDLPRALDRLGKRLGFRAGPS